MIIEFLKKHKRIFILGLIIAAAILVIVLVGNFGTKTEPSRPPLIINTQKTESPFIFVSASPPSGPRETIDSLQPVAFLFSEPVDIKSVIVKVVPFVKVRTKVFDSTPETLWVEPDNSSGGPMNTAYWKDEVEYKITISNSLKSISGNKLNKEVQYTLYKTTPAFINAGDLN